MRRDEPIETEAITEPFVRAEGTDRVSVPIQIAGRYVIESVLGSGAMGIVYAARDTALERDVAIKRVRRAPHGPAHDRLVREAKAMAQLDHPSVVTVFDAGIADGGAYVAMERVNGLTLRSWLASKRTWRQIVDVFVQCARGLAAAHEAGIIHGDFKPDNVLVDDSGRARVADFGLARVIDAGKLAEREHPLEGTPVYMAPEQLDGRETTAASDQYAFGASLYEALCGRRPFDGRALDELREQQMMKIKLPRVRGSNSLTRIVERCLSEDPAKRYTSMTEVATALAAVPPRRTTLLLALGLCVVVTGVAMGAWTAGSSAAGACGDGAAELAEVWNDARRGSIAASLAATGHPNARDMSSAVIQTVDAYAVRWRSAHQSICRATRSGAQSQDLLDTKMRCLARRRGALQATLDVIAGLDRDGVDKAMAIVAKLSTIESCTDIIGGDGPQTKAARAATLAIHAEIDRAEAELESGRRADARQRLTLAIDRAHRDQLPAAEAHAWSELADLEFDAAQFTAADTALARALDAASRAGDDHRIAQTLVDVVVQLTTQGLRRSEVTRAVTLAEAAIVRAGDDARQRVRLHGTLGNYHLYAEQNLDQAEAHYARGIELAAQLAEPPRSALFVLRIGLAQVAHRRHQIDKVRAELATAKKWLGDEPSTQMTTIWFLTSCMVNTTTKAFDDARKDCETALEAIRTAMGAEHPDIAAVEGSLGDLLIDQGKPALALQPFEHAEQICVRTWGPSHPNTIAIRQRLGGALRELGRLEQAERTTRAALTASEGLRGADHPGSAPLHSSLARILRDRGNLVDAEAEFGRALSLSEQNRDPDTDLAKLRHSRGEVRIGLSKYELARDDFEHAFSIRQRALGMSNADTLESLCGLGGVLVQLGEYGEGITRLEQAHRLIEKHFGASHEMISYTLGGLGEAFRLSGDFVSAERSFEKVRTMLSAAGGDEIDLGVAT
ncbi:MAG: tetratricopeptide repeat protein, partial [Kofleriaceae bacterium]